MSSSGVNVDIISHSGAIIVSADMEAAADKAMQIHSGILIAIKLRDGSPWKSSGAKEFIKVWFKIQKNSAITATARASPRLAFPIVGPCMKRRRRALSDGAQDANERFQRQRNTGGTITTQRQRVHTGN